MGCARLEAATYQDPAVAEFLNGMFVPVKINKHDRPDVARRYEQGWTPLLVALHPREIQLRNWVGYLPADAFLGELHMARAAYELRSGHPALAMEWLKGILANSPESHVAPEALFWQGVAAYRVSGGDKHSILPYWSELTHRFPDHPWALRTTFHRHWNDQFSDFNLLAQEGVAR